MGCGILKREESGMTIGLGLSKDIDRRSYYLLKSESAVVGADLLGRGPNLSMYSLRTAFNSKR